MDKLELIFIMIEAICIFIEIALEIYSIIDSKKQEKNLLCKLHEINLENKILEKLLKGK